MRCLLEESSEEPVLSVAAPACLSVKNFETVIVAAVWKLDILLLRRSTLTKIV